MDLAILGLLTSDDMHGYELKKRLGELPGTGIHVSFGSLYPALARLERAGSVIAVKPTGSIRPTTPMTGALSGELAAFKSRVLPTTAASTVQPDMRGRRAKKVYRITDPGRSRLQGLLLDDVDDERSFHLRVAFAMQLEPDQRTAIFKTRRRQLHDQLEAARGRAASPATNPYLRLLEEHDLTTLDRNIAWIDMLIATPSDGHGAVSNDIPDALNTITGGTSK